MYEHSIKRKKLNRLSVTETPRLSWTASPPEDDIAASGRFASGISHDINNPLTVIMMATSFLLEDLPPKHPSRKDVLNIMDEAERIRTMLRTLSEYAHTEIGDRALVNLNRIIRSLIKNELPRIERQGVNSIIRLSRLPVIASVDRARFEQALGYILDNALDAMPSGGLLEIHTGRTQGRAWVAIADSGAGIRRDHLSLIFEPLFTASNTRGMGLAFARRIIKLHGGVIDVESYPGYGTTFTVSLPLAVPTP